MQLYNIELNLYSQLNSFTYHTHDYKLSTIKDVQYKINVLTLPKGGTTTARIAPSDWLNHRNLYNHLANLHTIITDCRLPPAQIPPETRTWLGKRSLVGVTGSAASSAPCQPLKHLRSAVGKPSGRPGSPGVARGRPGSPGVARGRLWCLSGRCSPRRPKG